MVTHVQLRLVPMQACAREDPAAGNGLKYSCMELMVLVQRFQLGELVHTILVCGTSLTTSTFLEGERCLLTVHEITCVM